jgi:hypothetical protein
VPLQESSRASRKEIFLHLETLLGSEACEVSQNAADLFLARKKQEGISVLSGYDAKLGGIGIYQIKDEKLPGIYRALTYVLMDLEIERPEDHTRSMVYAACVYLEELLKKLVRLWPWEAIKSDSLPLGTLVNRIQKRLPAPLFNELTWLSYGVYNFAKHHYNLEDDEEPEPEHYFGIDEAIAIYLIVRKLGLELEGLFGRPKIEAL